LEAFNWLISIASLGTLNAARSVTERKQRRQPERWQKHASGFRNWK